MSTSWLLGLDFGTADTAAAAMESGSPSASTVRLSSDGPAMSSAVFVESPNAITAGQTAVDAAERNPSGWTPTPKRSVGLHAVSINGYDVEPVRLVTAVLGEAVNRATTARAAQAQPGRTELPSQLILTHPEDWAADEVRVLHDAATALGFTPNSIRTISEPRATAHHCVPADIAAGTRVGVFDLGAGTLDVTVLEADGYGRFNVLAARRDHALGGIAFDAAIRGWVDIRLASENPQLLTHLRETSPAGDLRHLDDSIRRAKELLSTEPTATITVTGAGHHQNIELTRNVFHSLIDEMITRGVGLFEQVLGDAGVRGSDLHTVYLTGGCSRIQLVYQRLSPIASVITVDDPKTVVARGALTAATVGAVDTAPTVNDHTSPAWSPPVAAEPRPTELSGRKKVWAGIAVAAVILVAGGGLVLNQTVFSGDADAVTGGSPAAAAGSDTVPGLAASADPAADEKAIRELTAAYAREVPGAGADVVNSFRCAEKQVTPNQVVPDPGEKLAIDEIISVATHGDTANARVRVTQTLSGTEPITSTHIFSYTREDGGWKICGITDQ